MIRQTLILAILPVAFGTNAACVTDPPELGDIGPSSELVCARLERQFPGATLAIDGRSIQSPTDVSVVASVDGKPIVLRYALSGFTWSVQANRMFANGAVPSAPHPGAE